MCCTVHACHIHTKRGGGGNLQAALHFGHFLVVVLDLLMLPLRLLYAIHVICSTHIQYILSYTSYAVHTCNIHTYIYMYIYTYVYINTHTPNKVAGETCKRLCIMDISA